jgi:nucleoside-diphosphate-sugar epimerase
MQTILGAGGAIGIGLARSLTAYTKKIRLVSRDPRKVNDTDELLRADLTDREQVFRAVANSQVVYLTIGLPYSARAWQDLWPPLMRNVIDACVAHRARLVFFDNVYALSRKELEFMTEESVLGPSSKKGEARARVDRMLLEKIAQGKLLAVIARSPDFFGPIKANSAVMAMVYDNLAQGKKPVWFCNAQLQHSLGYTPELTRALAKLGNTSFAFNQVWNLPTAKPITGEKWAKLFARALKVPGQSQVRVLPKWAVRMLGLFVPVLKETCEMLYQYDRPYFFSSSKYERAFNHTPISNEDAVLETVQVLQHTNGGQK